MSLRFRLARAYRRLTLETRPSYQVIGERCSGTNFTDALIAANLALKPSKAFGWKHGLPAFVAPPPNTVFVAVFRSVVPWLVSLYRKPWHTSEAMRTLSFSDFLRAEWDTVVDVPYYFGLADTDPRVGMPLHLDRHPVSGRRYRNVLEMRRVKMERLLALGEEDANIVYRTHAELTADPAGLLGEVAARAGIAAPARTTVPQEHFGWVWNDRLQRIGAGQPQVSPADLQFILAHCDPELERRAGLALPAACGADAG